MEDQFGLIDEQGSLSNYFSMDNGGMNNTSINANNPGMMPGYFPHQQQSSYMANTQQGISAPPYRQVQTQGPIYASQQQPPQQQQHHASMHGARPTLPQQQQQQQIHSDNGIGYYSSGPPSLNTAQTQPTSSSSNAMIYNSQITGPSKPAFPTYNPATTSALNNSSTGSSSVNQYVMNSSNTSGSNGGRGYAPLYSNAAINPHAAPPSIGSMYASVDNHDDPIGSISSVGPGMSQQSSTTGSGIGTMSHYSITMGQPSMQFVQQQQQQQPLSSSGQSVPGSMQGVRMGTAIPSGTQLVPHQTVAGRPIQFPVANPTANTMQQQQQPGMPSNNSGFPGNAHSNHNMASNTGGSGPQHQNQQQQHYTASSTAPVSFMPGVSTSTMAAMTNLYQHTAENGNGSGNHSSNVNNHPNSGLSNVGTGNTSMTAAVAAATESNMMAIPTNDFGVPQSRNESTLADAQLDALRTEVKNVSVTLRHMLKQVKYDLHEELQRVKYRASAFWGRVVDENGTQMYENIPSRDHQQQQQSHYQTGKSVDINGKKQSSIPLATGRVATAVSRHNRSNSVVEDNANSDENSVRFSSTITSSSDSVDDGRRQQQKGKKFNGRDNQKLNNSSNGVSRNKGSSKTAAAQKDDDVSQKQKKKNNLTLSSSSRYRAMAKTKESSDYKHSHQNGTSSRRKLAIKRSNDDDDESQTDRLSDAQSTSSSTSTYEQGRYYGDDDYNNANDSSSSAYSERDTSRSKLYRGNDYNDDGGSASSDDDSNFVDEESSSDRTQQHQSRRPKTTDRPLRKNKQQHQTHRQQSTSNAKSASLSTHHQRSVGYENDISGSTDNDEDVDNYDTTSHISSRSSKHRTNQYQHPTTSAQAQQRRSTSQQGHQNHRRRNSSVAQRGEPSSTSSMTKHRSFATTSTAAASTSSTLSNNSSSYRRVKYEQKIHILKVDTPLYLMMPFTDGCDEYGRRFYWLQTLAIDPERGRETIWWVKAYDCQTKRWLIQQFRYRPYNPPASLSSVSNNNMSGTSHHPLGAAISALLDPAEKQKQQQQPMTKGSRTITPQPTNTTTTNSSILPSSSVVAPNGNNNEAVAESTLIKTAIVSNMSMPDATASNDNLPT